MTLKTAEQQLEELIAAREKATKEFYLRYSPQSNDDEIAAPQMYCMRHKTDYLIEGYDNVDFINSAANFASTAAPQLLGKLKRMREALEYYANGIGWSEQQDNGEIARKALEDK